MSLLDWLESPTDTSFEGLLKALRDQRDDLEEYSHEGGADADVYHDQARSLTKLLSRAESEGP